MDSPVLNVVLDGRAFRELVAGKEVAPAEQSPLRPAVRILLADIGWDVMRLAIDEAEAAQADQAESSER